MAGMGVAASRCYGQVRTGRPNGRDLCWRLGIGLYWRDVHGGLILRLSQWAASQFRWAEEGIWALGWGWGGGGSGLLWCGG